MHNNNNDNNNNLMLKISSKDIFCGISINSTFMNGLLCKTAVLHTTTLMHCKATQVLCDLFSTSHGNCSEMAFVARSY